MPPRAVTLAIVVFWLAMMTWLFYREVRPRLLPGEPPPFPITMPDETKQASRKQSWRVFKNGEESYTQKGDEKYTLETRSPEYSQADDTFTFHGELKVGRKVADAPRPAGAPELPTFKNIRVVSSYHVDRQGRMLGLKIVSDYELDLAGDALEANVQTTGEPRDEQFAPLIAVTLPGLNQKAGGDRQLEGVPVSWHGVVLNPFHPVTHMPGLQGGRTWRVPVVDPLGFPEVVEELAPKLEDANQARTMRNIAGLLRGVKIFEARVEHDPSALHWNRREYDCWKVHYTSEELVLMEMTTWVRVADGMVLQQDVSLWGDQWRFLREN